MRGEKKRFLKDISGSTNMCIKEDPVRRESTDGEEAIMTLVKEENVPEINTDLDVQIETTHKVPSKRDEEKNKKRSRKLVWKILKLQEWGESFRPFQNKTTIQCFLCDSWERWLDGVWLSRERDCYPGSLTHPRCHSPFRIEERVLWPREYITPAWEGPEETTGERTM